MDGDSETWRAVIWRNNLSDLNLSVGLLFVHNKHNIKHITSSAYFVIPSSDRWPLWTLSKERSFQLVATWWQVKTGGVGCLDHLAVDLVSQGDLGYLVQLAATAARGIMDLSIKEATVTGTPPYFPQTHLSGWRWILQDTLPVIQVCVSSN